jgi:methionyl-tRNA formyltransferase
MRVAAIGRTSWLYGTVERVRADGHEIAFIATAPAAPEYTATENDFEQLAAEIGCPFHLGVDIPEEPADVAVSVNWPTLIQRDVLERFPYGVLNGHPGALPRFRGNAAPNWAIIAGEPHVVATVHRMTEGLDEGPILAQRAFDLDEHTYIGDVYAFLDATFPELFAEAVSGLAAGALEPRSQPRDPSLTLRGYPRLPRDSEIDWQQSASEIARLVRASAEPFTGAYSWLGDRRLTVWRAYADDAEAPWVGVPGHVAHRDSKRGTATLLTGDGLLVVEEAELDGRRAPAAELLTSARMRLGLDTQTLLDRLEHLEAQAGR